MMVRINLVFLPFFTCAVLIFPTDNRRGFTYPSCFNPLSPSSLTPVLTGLSFFFPFRVFAKTDLKGRGGEKSLFLAPAAVHIPPSLLLSFTSRPPHPSSFLPLTQESSAVPCNPLRRHTLPHTDRKEGELIEGNTPFGDNVHFCAASKINFTQQISNLRRKTFI